MEGSFPDSRAVEPGQWPERIDDGPALTAQPPTASSHGAPAGSERALHATLLAILAVTVAAVVPYLSTLTAYFTGDDFGLVYLFSNKPPLHVLSLFTSPWTESIYGIYADELRPLVALSYQVDSLWHGGSAPFGYHLSNIVFHLINALLVLAIARSAARLNLLPATFAAALFAVLPPQAEPVGWISGRADSIPSMFYLGALLGYVLWRRGAGSWPYGLAVAAHFLALFSKQSAITLVGMLLLYDALIERRLPTFRWRSWRPYLPFALLTAGYLGLRLVLFRSAVREDQLTIDALAAFAARQATYIKILLTGSARTGEEWITPDLAAAGRVGALVLIALMVGLILWRVAGLARGVVRRPSTLLFFGPAWWLVTIAPLVVTYESARHLYQPSVGPAVAAGLLLQELLRRSPAWRPVVLAGAAALILTSTLFVLRPLSAWNAAAAVSEKVGRDLEQVGLAAPPGSLLVVGAPAIARSDRYHVWLWMWAMPYAVRPPFRSPELSERVRFIEQPDIYCCPREQWHASLRAAVADWADDPAQPPAILLRWDATSGLLDRQTEHDHPDLRPRLLSLRETTSPQAACEQLEQVLGWVLGCG